MKKRMNVFISTVIAVVLCFSFVACGSKNGGSAKTVELRLAYQYGLQYLPAKIVQDQKLIEKYYDGDVNVSWQTVNSGPAINEAALAGSIDGGFFGTPMAITGVNAGVPYKIVCGISNIGNRLITNQSGINSLADFKKGDQIAIPSKGGIQHITLAMAAKKELGDAHALDDNLVGMSHPDGMTALQSGAVQAHFTTIPYWGEELAAGGTHEVKDVAADAAPGSTAIVFVLNTKIYEENPALYQATVKAFQEAIDYLNNPANYDAIAESMYKDMGISKGQLIAYLNSGDVKFDMRVTGLMEFVNFMSDEGFIDKTVSKDQASYVFEGVEVKPLP